MVHRLVNGLYLARSKKIKDSAVLDWNIVKEDPPVLYALIKGSARDPYHLIIDMESKRLGHDCPVFSQFIQSQKYSRRRRRRGSSPTSPWCKHFGKLLLLAGKPIVDQIIKTHTSNELTFNNTKSSLKRAIEILQKRVVEEGDLSSNSIYDNLGYLDRKLKQGESNVELELELLDQILVTLEGKNIFTQLLMVSEWLSHIPNTRIAKIDELLDKTFSKILLEAYDIFFKQFWVTSVFRRMEQAYLLRLTGKLLDFDYYDLDIPLDPAGIPQEEREDGAIVINALISDQKLKYATMNQIGITYNKQKILYRYRMLTNELRLKGSANDKFKKWLNDRLSYKDHKVNGSIPIDDFLIYVLKLTNYSPKAGILSRNGSVYTIDKQELSTYPALHYCVERIKESERDYITQSEYSRYSKFINYINGNQVVSSYIEKKRDRIEDYNLPTRGIIIQWDVDPTANTREKISANVGSDRVILNDRSTISSKVQPFDITICRLPLKKEDEYLISAFVKEIISPQQAIKLIGNGLEIISPLLPWDILYRYHNNMKITRVEIDQAISFLDNYYFIYGAIELKNELEEIAVVSSSNLNEDKFKELSKSIKLKTTFDGVIMDQAKALIDSEGIELQATLDILNLSTQERSRLVLNALHKAEDPTELRDLITQEIVNLIIKSGNPGYIFDQIRSIDFKIYPIPQLLTTKIRQEITRLNKRFARRPPTKKILRKNLVGLSILNTLEIEGDGKLSEVEKEAIDLKLEQLVKEIGI